MDTLVEKMLASPDLPHKLHALNEAFVREQARRARFYDEMTPNRRMEFINGQIVLHSPARWRHSETMGLLHTLLSTYVNRRKLGKVGMAKVLITLTRNDYEPDVVFFGLEKAATITPEQMKFPAPDLAVEVLSPSTERRDRGIKKRDYAAHGVREYWLVDAVKRAIEQYELDGREYVLLGIWKNEEPITSLLVPGFSIPVAAAFEPEANLAALDSFAR